jgi:hypothetical protein
VRNDETRCPFHRTVRESSECNEKGKKGGMHFNDKIEMAEIVVAAGGCVASYDVLAIDSCLNGDMLANGKT